MTDDDKKSKPPVVHFVERDFPIVHVTPTAAPVPSALRAERRAPPMRLHFWTATLGNA